MLIRRGTNLGATIYSPLNTNYVLKHRYSNVELETASCEVNNQRFDEDFSLPSNPGNRTIKAGQRLQIRAMKRKLPG